MRAFFNTVITFGWGTAWCLWRHKRLLIIKWTGVESKHVWCETCHREYGMHDGLQIILPWEYVKEFYKDL